MVKIPHERVLPFFSHVPSVKHNLVPDTILRKTFVLFVLLYLYLFMAVIWLLDTTYGAVVWATPLLGFDATQFCSARLALKPVLRWNSLRDHCPRQWKELGSVWSLDDCEMAWSSQIPAHSELP